MVLVVEQLSIRFQKRMMYISTVNSIYSTVNKKKAKFKDIF